jgi:DNA-binding HxlR family transcriptional regulator
LFTPLTYTGGIDVTKVEEYSSQIPLIVRQAFKAFGSDNRCAIVVALYEHDGRLTFNRLKTALELDPRTLTNELKTLRNGAIVTHYTEYTEGTRDHSYYELTDFGVDILKAAFSVLARPYQPTVELADITASGALEPWPVSIIAGSLYERNNSLLEGITC